MSDEDGDPPWYNESLLHELYLEEDLTMLEIADELGCTDGTICRALARYGITKSRYDDPWRDEDLLCELYVKEGLTCSEISSELGCSDETVIKWLQRTGVMDEREQDPWKDKEKLAELYHSKDSRQEMADSLGCSHGTVGYWLTKLGISDVRKDVEFDSAGPKHPWRDEKRLRQACEENSFDARVVAKQFGSTEKTIKRWMSRFGIEKPEKDISREDFPDEYPWREKWVLEELHHHSDMSQLEICVFLNCSQNTISRWMDKFEIEVTSNIDKPSKEQLKELYIEKELSTIEISRRLDVDDATIYRWLVDFGISVRGSARRDQLVDELRDGEWLQQQHLDKEKSLAQIGRELNCSTGTVRTWALRHGIDIRPAGESIRGENHPHWKGGSEPYGKGWNEAKKEKVRERDNRVCQACGLAEDKHIELTGKRLHVHHIIPARQFKNPEGRNSAENLVSLCAVCHQQWEGIPVRPTFETQ